MVTLACISREFTAQTLDEIIRKAGGTKHTSYRFGAETKKGDSYLSKVYRLSVCGINEQTGETLDVKLIVKSMPDNLARRQLFRSVVFFRNEINFYTRVIPELERFQNARAPKNPFVEYPKCYAALCDGANDFIALDDVSFKGFCAPNRQNSLTLDECLLTLRTLARYHALALAYKALEPVQFALTAQHVEETYYGEPTRQWYGGFLERAKTVALDAVERTYPDSDYARLTARFLSDGLFDELIRLVNTRSRLAVFGHGDCWAPNFLRRYKDDGTIAGITIIDFQLVRYASLALDISVFVGVCTSQQMREQHYTDMLRAYHESACALLADVGADPAVVLPWQALLDELKHFGAFGCGMGIEILPLSLLEDDEVAELDEINDGTGLHDVWNIKPLKLLAKRQRIADMFKFAIDNGYIK